MGLKKVKDGVALIKISKEKLGNLENEFKKVKADLGKEIDLDK